MSFEYLLYQQFGFVIFGLMIISIWELIWKGIGLWHSAKNKQLGWFIVILIFNTAGILPIIYYFWFKPEEKIIKRRSSKKKIKRKVKS